MTLIIKQTIELHFLINEYSFVIGLRYGDGTLSSDAEKLPCRRKHKFHFNQPPFGGFLLLKAAQVIRYLRRFKRMKLSS